MFSLFHIPRAQTVSLFHSFKPTFSSSGMNLNILSNVISISQVNPNDLNTKLGDIGTFKFLDGDRTLEQSLYNPLFYDFSGKKIYSKEALFNQVRQNDFFVFSSEQNKLVAVLRDDPFDRQSPFSSQQETVLNEAKNLNLSKQEQSILSDYITRFASQLLSSNFSQVDTQYVQMVNKKVLAEISLNSKQKIAIYDGLLSVLRKKLALIEDKQKDLTSKIDKKQLKYMKRFFGLLLSKVFILQYCTYVLLSWDIMEPITCLFGIFDITAGYLYWLLTHSEFDYSNLKERYLRKKRFTPEIASLVGQTEDIQSLIDYVQQLRDMESPNLETIVSQL